MLCVCPHHTFVLTTLVNTAGYMVRIAGHPSGGRAGLQINRGGLPKDVAAERAARGSAQGSAASLTSVACLGAGGVMGGAAPRVPAVLPKLKAGGVGVGAMLVLLLWSAQP